MSGSLFDGKGRRKYLTTSERLAFVKAAMLEDELTAAFCLTLAITGARISEALALTGNNLDAASGAIVFKTLKQRDCVKFRAVPAPHFLLGMLAHVHHCPTARIWPWGRTTAWKIVKTAMREAKIASDLCKPKALRHGFAVEAIQQKIPLTIVQRWMGHSRLETTAIYVDVLGEEERRLAQRSWNAIAALIQSTRPHHSLLSSSKSG